jgi:hypothetical protein
VEQLPQDPTQPTPPYSHPAPRVRRPAPPRGPVTRLSKVAGVIVLLLGLAVTAYGGYGVVWSATSDSYLKGISILIASVVVVMGLPALLAGIGILRGAEWGRVIGIIYSLSLGLVSFA